MASKVTQQQPADRNDSTAQRAAHDGPGLNGGASITDLQLRFREALVLWLRWNEAYERVTARMFQAKDDPRQLESLMDQMDQLRTEAVRLSHQLLN